MKNDAKVSLTGVGATNLEVTETTVAGSPAVRIDYHLKAARGLLKGLQVQIPTTGGKTCVLTITALDNIFRPRPTRSWTRSPRSDPDKVRPGQDGSGYCEITDRNFPHGSPSVGSALLPRCRLHRPVKDPRTSGGHPAIKQASGSPRRSAADPLSSQECE